MGGERASSLRAPLASSPALGGGHRGPPRRRTHYFRMDEALEVDAQTQLRQALLSLERVAGVEGRLLADRVAVGVEDVDIAGGVLLVEQVEDLGDEIGGDPRAEVDLLGQPEVDLREVVGASRVDVG